MVFALIVVYFYVGRRVAGGTLWDRFFGISGEPQPQVTNQRSPEKSQSRAPRRAAKPAAPRP